MSETSIFYQRVIQSAEQNLEHHQLLTRCLSFIDALIEAGSDPTDLSPDQVEELEVVSQGILFYLPNTVEVLLPNNTILQIPRQDEIENGEIISLLLIKRKWAEEFINMMLFTQYGLSALPSTK